MKKPSSFTVILASLVFLTGFWFVLRSEESSASIPVVDVDQPSVDSPGEVSGVAGDPSGEDVEVRAYIDGQEIGVDDHMEGGMNIFRFDIPEGHSGKMVEIVAENESGVTTRTYVPIT